MCLLATVTQFHAHAISDTFILFIVPDHQKTINIDNHSTLVIVPKLKKLLHQPNIVIAQKNLLLAQANYAMTAITIY